MNDDDVDDDSIECSIRNLTHQQLIYECGNWRRINNFQTTVIPTLIDALTGWSQPIFS
jgi:hypothetical protein